MSPLLMDTHGPTTTFRITLIILKDSALQNKHLQSVKKNNLI